MTSSWKMNQLDFRFADEEDAEDIKTLVRIDSIFCVVQFHAMISLFLI
jgi:hypothetical protein